MRRFPLIVGILIVGMALIGCATSRVIPEPGKITLEEAMEQVGNGLNKMYDIGKDYPKIGVIDEQWEKLRSDNSNIWDDKELIAAGKQYATLYNAQFKAITSRKGLAEYAEKALNYAVISSWAYVAGLLQDNKTRLERHYALADKTSTDPLNAIALSKGRHKTDPENYRGLSTRTDLKERGRLVELFFAQAEKGEGISSGLVDYAIKNWSRRIMETFSQFTIVTPFNQRRSLCQVSLFLRYQDFVEGSVWISSETRMS